MANRTRDPELPGIVEKLGNVPGSAPDIFAQGSSRDIRTEAPSEAKEVTNRSFCVIDAEGPALAGPFHEPQAEETA